MNKHKTSTRSVAQNRQRIISYALKEASRYVPAKRDIIDFSDLSELPLHGNLSIRLTELASAVAIIDETIRKAKIRQVAYLRELNKCVAKANKELRDKKKKAARGEKREDS